MIAPIPVFTGRPPTGIDGVPVFTGAEKSSIVGDN
jgi:hypothetical protein